MKIMMRMILGLSRQFSSVELRSNVSLTASAP